MTRFDRVNLSEQISMAALESINFISHGYQVWTHHWKIEDSRSQSNQEVPGLPVMKGVLWSPNLKMVGLMDKVQLLT